MSTPVQPDQTPNEVPYEVQVCPRCKSAEIHRRDGFHPLGRWGCRDCKRAFMVTSLQIRVLPVGEAPPGHWHWE